MPIRTSVDTQLSASYSLAASTHEMIDTALFNFINDELNIFCTTNEGFSKVPVSFAVAERAHQIKNDPTLRPNGRTLKYPLIAISKDSMMWTEHENSVISFFQPITSHQLADWGRAVRNCVGNSSYAGAINRKRYFIVLAMVDHKPRYTIQLKLSDGVLVVDQIADIGNRRLSDEEKDFVQKSIAYALQHIAEEDPNYEPEEVSNETEKV